MNNNKRAPKKRRGAKIGLAVCMAAAVVLTGVYTFQQYKSNVKNEMAKIEEESRQELEEYQSADAGDVINDSTDDVTEEGVSDFSGSGISEEAEDPASSGTDAADNGTASGGTTSQSGTSGTDSTANAVDSDSSTIDSAETAGVGSEINFSEGDKLIWPVSGAVLMNYSMDKTVYFATLEEYKYNPALIIGGAVNDQVISAGKGIVKSIDKTPQEGTTVTVDMGNGYEAIYGQLQNVQVKTGDSVEAKTVLGYLAEPTRYYSVEGCNLYFEFRKDGQPIDPLQYLSE
ncbi:M23 family metallopeptidase [Drancourtella massiliensis]|uniref:M23 family metallopeptidase n=2 Tax=Drancourtella massiliensis TaxID=1632013 RepID=A0ABS2EIW3_9FIRM|nr:M23 family metallopeptidase [Drancourtella massiliensis]